MARRRHSADSIAYTIPYLANEPVPILT